MVCNQILWQFTLKCNKNCKYCGSKDVINFQGQDQIDKIYIAKQIAELKPKEVTITGGQPSCNMDTLIECVKILNNANIKVKILTNGNLFKEYWAVNYREALYPMIYGYGLSINTLEDIQDVEDNKNWLVYSCFIPIEKTSIVTNFGKHNIGIFNNIAKFAARYNCWQVQLTIGNDLQLDLSEIKELKKNILQLKRLNKIINVVQADNIVCGRCGAGTHGCSICFNGDVIPCLSYRSWKKDLNVQGNVFNQNLKDIWQNQFKFFRNREFFPCCKSISGIEKVNNQQDNKSVFEKYPNIYPNYPTEYPNIQPPVVVVYGVNISNNPTCSTSLSDD